MRNIKLPEEFYRDGVVGGFYVSSMMKRAWAAQLEIFSDIAAICEKYGIKYFADAGTLIGTIRHGGFIPWDDDLDIVMMREDYEKFLKHTDELPEFCQVLNWRTDISWDDAFSRIVNTIAPNMEPDFMEKYHGFPFSAGVDVFVNDYMYRDEEEEKKRDKLWEATVNLAKAIRDGGVDKAMADSEMKKIEYITGYKLDRKKGDVKALFEVAEKLFCEVKREDADEAAFLPVFIRFGGNRYDIKWYEDSIPMPFEGISMPVPIWYDKILKNKYGNYLQAARTGGLHGYPFYLENMETLSRKTGWKPPEYKCDASEAYLPQEIRQTKNEQRDELASQLSQIENLMNMPGAESMFAALAPQVELLKSSLAQIDVKCNDVVFMPYFPEYWKCFEALWEKENKDPDNNVVVMPLPVYDMNLDGSTGALHYDLDAFPEKLHAVSVEEYDPSIRHPKRIYFQAPFDGYNPSASVHPNFYSHELLNYTDELVYVPCYNISDIPQGDERGRYTLGQFVKMPGVVHADRIILPHDYMKDIYINALCELCGEDTRGLWESRIEVDDEALG